MTPYQFRQFAYRALEVQREVVPDPGASGTIRVRETDRAVCEVTTATAESRALESASLVPLHCILTVELKTDGGDLTITGASNGSVILDDAGDFAVFVVTNANGTKQWRVLSASDLLTVTEDIAIDNDWRVWDALITNLAGADGTDDLGLVTGTYLTANPTFNVTVATPTNAPFYARRSYTLPSNYVSGTDLTIVLNATETVAATTANIDINAVDQDSPSSDIVATAAQSIIGASATDYSFTVTGTNLKPGDVLDIRISITLNDAAATPNYSINSVKITRSVF